MEQRIVYTCDPELNVDCAKESCHLNGGPCTQTKNLNFAKQPVETAKLQIPMSQEEYNSLVAGEVKSMSIESEQQRTVFAPNRKARRIAAKQEKKKASEELRKKARQYGFSK